MNMENKWFCTAMDMVEDNNIKVLWNDRGKWDIHGRKWVYHSCASPPYFESPQPNDEHSFFVFAHEFSHFVHKDFGLDYETEVRATEDAIARIKEINDNKISDELSNEIWITLAHGCVRDLNFDTIFNYLSFNLIKYLSKGRFRPRIPDKLKPYIKKGILFYHIRREE